MRFNIGLRVVLLFASSMFAPSVWAQQAASEPSVIDGGNQHPHAPAEAGATQRDAGAAPSTSSPPASENSSSSQPPIPAIEPSAPIGGTATNPETEPIPRADGTPVPELAASDAGAPSANSKPGALPHDLSPWGMFQAADIVVKFVMVGLAIASFITWTVWAAKATELWAAKRRLKRAIRQVDTAPSLGAAVEAFARNRGPGAALVRAAGEELARSLPVLDYADGHGVKERVTSRLSRIEANAGRRMTLGTGVLATIGATAPFVGLFGTVWGIMNSFIGISQSQTTNLAVVAPGIAEALLATAIGLVAAIPAVIIYNVFARGIAGYKFLLADASAGVERLVSWELDARRVPAGAPFAQAAE